LVTRQELVKKGDVPSPSPVHNPIIFEKDTGHRLLRVFPLVDQVADADGGILKTERELDLFA
jgi:hypothetical protein